MRVGPLTIGASTAGAGPAHAASGRQTATVHGHPSSELPAAAGRLS